MRQQTRLAAVASRSRRSQRSLSVSDYSISVTVRFMPRRRRASYAWARHVDADALLADVREGLSYARLLAENNLRWSRQAPRKGPRPFPLTAEQLARVTAVSATTVRRRIADARFVLYGGLSDSGIYYRRSQAKRRERGERTCRAPDCGNALPAKARVSRRYCDRRCRRRHHYQRPRLAAEAQAAIGEWDGRILRAGSGRSGVGTAKPARAPPPRCTSSSSTRALRRLSRLRFPRGPSCRRQARAFAYGVARARAGGGCIRRSRGHSGERGSPARSFASPSSSASWRSRRRFKVAASGGRSLSVCWKGRTRSRCPQSSSSSTDLPRRPPTSTGRSASPTCLPTSG